MSSRLSKWDRKVTQRLCVAEKTGLLRTLAALLARSGDSWFWLAGLALLGLLGGDSWKGRALAMAAGVLVTAVLVLAIKFAVHRRRPQGEWGQIYRQTDPNSVPSGHAARAAMLAVMALGLGPAWFGLLLAVWAPLVILARVMMGVHYFSDVAAGALLGILLGALYLQVLPTLLPF